MCIFFLSPQGPFNALDVNHYPGGSSSGSAVAVALGIVPFAIGFDVSVNTCVFASCVYVYVCV